VTLHLPEFSSNAGSGADRRTVGSDISATLRAIVDSGKLTNAPPLDIASAYFNAAGYELISDALDGVGPVRLLLGAEPTDAHLRGTITPLDVRAARKGDPRITQALAHHEAALVEDRDLAGFGAEVDALIERLINWLERDDVEVRRLEKGFLHGKAFIVDAAGDSALAGSSNLTRAGLSVNRELNVGVYTPSVVAQVRAWFDEQWDAAAPYDLAELYRARRVPHDPYLVFMRMLLALYGRDLAENPEFDGENELGLAKHQLDGVHRARRILKKRRGVIIADEVGLGKTFIAGELIREAAVERRQKVLVVAPAALRDTTWRPFLETKNLPAKVVSYEELAQEVENGPTGVPKLEIDETTEDYVYSLVVVDEAHHIRNAGTARAAAMRHVLSGKVAKDLVLLSATPVNNSLQDLYNLLGYINPSDAAFKDIGVTSLAEYFNHAMSIDPDELSGEHLFEVLDAIAVRRTRRFIKTQYPDLVLPDGTPIVFPQAKVHRVDYELDDVLPGFFERFAAALGVGLDDDKVVEPSAQLTMARYVPSRYGGDDEEHQYQVQNAGLLQSALLKRFESSSAAFCSTLGVMINSQNEFLAALSKGYVLTGAALRGWVATDSDDVEGYLSDLDEEYDDNVAPASEYDVEALRAAVESDRALLAKFKAEVETVGWRDDPKIAALADALADVAKAAAAEGTTDDQVRDLRKVLMFTYFADTAKYVRDAITTLIEEREDLAPYRGRVALAMGGDKGGQRDAIIGFAPKTGGGGPGAPDLYDLVIATDVLSEGVNLQQAGQIINYDLPWNPMRLVQRHGRVDRIGSKHAYIHLRCFFPDSHLEQLLALEKRLQLKLKHAAAAFGADEVLPGMQPVERVLSETAQEIEKLRDEDAGLFDPERGASASSEEFQRRLQRALESDTVKRQIQGLPWGAGTGLVKPGARSGVVFCVIVADHPRPFFRFVPTEPDVAGEHLPVHLDSDKFEVVDAMLASLNAADPGDPPAPAHLTEAMHRSAYTAWPLARDSVYEDWMARTDPANIAPKIPKAMRDAGVLVRKHGLFLGEQQDRLARRFEQVVESRYVKLVREALRQADDEPGVAVEALRKLADELRLPVPTPVEAMPRIELEDVRVLCWAAVTSSREGES